MPCLYPQKPQKPGFFKKPGFLNPYVTSVEQASNHHKLRHLLAAALSYRYSKQKLLNQSLKV